MGQDRKFTDEQKMYALNAVYQFRTQWENFEMEKLEADRDAWVKEREHDAEVFTEEFKEQQKEKEEQLVEAKINP